MKPFVSVQFSSVKNIQVVQPIIRTFSSSHHPLETNILFVEFEFLWIWLL